MGLKYYSKELNDCGHRRRLPSNIDLSSYQNSSFSYYQNDVCTSPETLKTDISDHIYASIRNYNGINHSRKVSDYYHNNIYANISKSVTKTIPILDETFYTTLDNTTSTNIDYSVHVKSCNENNKSQRIYQNIKSTLRTLPKSNYQKKSNPSAHLYVNIREHYQDLATLVKNSSSNDIQSTTSTSSKERTSTDIETRTNTNTIQMVKKLEVNLAPSCRDKSLLYRTKIPAVISSFRQRQTMHRTKRHQRRRATPSSLLHAVETVQSSSKSNSIDPHYAIPVDKSRRDDTLYDKQHTKSVSNQLYNEIQQTKVADSQSFESICGDENDDEEEEDDDDDDDDDDEIIGPESNFHKILQQQVFAWYPTETYNEDEPKGDTGTRSANEESHRQDEVTHADADKLCPHQTFEDFLLRRRPKSSCSTLVNATQTITQELRNESLSVTQRSQGVTLGLDKKDVDFIHAILERSQSDHPLSNRLIALREAYIRAENKRKTVQKTKAIPQIDVSQKTKAPKRKPSLTATKIREELKKYDVLPTTQTPPVEDEEYYDDDELDDDTYSTYQRTRTNCTIPVVLSTAHRFMNFVSSVKRQIQKNIHDIRTRILIETMPVPPNHRARHRHAVSGPSRRHAVHRPKMMHYSVYRTNSHHSIQCPNPVLRHQLNRTCSSSSHALPTHRHSYPYSFTGQNLSDCKRTFRVTPCHRRS